MAEPLIIVGAGGQGRETAWTFLQEASSASFLGFLDDRAAGATPEGWPILGTIDSAPAHRAAGFLVAINAPRTRRAVVGRLGQLGVSRWTTVVDPSVRLHASVRLGEGCAVLGGCQVTTSVDVGSHVILNRACQVGHDCKIGSFCSVNPGACIAGRVSVGDGCELGSGCMVRQGLFIGPGSMIGMGAVALADVASDAVVVGNPARPSSTMVPW